ncbi:MAG: hypothetical protein V7L29_22675 [Nostoc sp.]|uniref:hypothetical protein n=1 Tax=Nostoc sp. TaxID=1180 RepID=UPI002FFAEB82
MAKTGRYCKACLLKQLREFSLWTEHLENVRKENQQVDGNVVEVERKLTDDNFLFLQENYVVTDGIIKDDIFIFDNVTPEWKEFCQTKLLYEIPVDEPFEIKPSAGKDNANS